MQLPSSSSKNERIYKWLAFIAIGLGIAVRIAVYIQNRNLMIDESNVARNIYERGFPGLALPLSYEQYAPPVWLWGIKLSTIVLGYSEQALRLLPLISGVAALWVMYQILKTLKLGKAAWYALALMCFGYLFIRYSTELKQYMTDVLVVLSLLLLALKTDITNCKPVRFLLIWVLAGSIAIWACMPSVFMLAGIGGYYFFNCLQNKNYKKLLPVAVISVIWLLQFGMYYWFILKSQANSQYLQDYHKKHFMILMPHTVNEWMQNFDLLSDFLGQSSGHTFLAKAMHMIMISWCCVLLLRKNRPLLSLLALPLLFMLLAAAANQYTMIPRVVLFAMPLLLIMIAYSLNIIMNTQRVFLKGLVIAACVLCVVNASALRFLILPLETESITDALSFVQKHDIRTGNNLYLHNGAVPSFIYYTTIHPNKAKWDSVKNAHPLNWDMDYSIIAEQAPSPSAFIFTSIDAEDLRQRKVLISRHMHCTDSMDKKGSYAYVYSR